MAGFELKQATATMTVEDEGVVVPVCDAAGTPLVYGSDNRPVTITVAGSYSSRHRKADQAFNAKLVQRQRRGGGDLADVLERRGVEIAAACVLAWDGFFLDEAAGKVFPMTAANAELVFTSARWVYDAVWEAMNDHAGFSRPTSST